MTKLRWLLAMLVAVAIAPLPLLAQQPATVSGRVTGAGGSPEAAVIVRISSLNLGTTTAADGSYRIVIPGARLSASSQLSVTASKPGLSTVSHTVTVAPGSEVTQNFALATAAVQLGEVVATGVVGPTARVKVPFAISTVKADEISRVPPVSAAGAIQGKVAGAQVVQGSGAPGSAPSILLRAPTSINANGRSQEPLYIVDGVILSGGLADINSLDIESVEVVKGAAGASLYGSRAANGVVQITTKRGRNAGGHTRYTFRSELGKNDIEGSIELAHAHPFLMTADQSQFICGTRSSSGVITGVPCNYDEVSKGSLITNGPGPFTTFQVNPFPGTNYDQMRVYRPGTNQQQYVAAEGSSGSTNFFGSFDYVDEPGVLRGNNGYQRRNFRLNLDHGLGSKVQLSASGFYSQADRDEIATSGSGSPFFNLTFMPPNIDLLARDSTGSLIVTGDPRSPLEYPNPLYEIENRDRTTETQRFLGNTGIRLSPLSWLNIDGNLSYDRTDWARNDYYPKGYRTKSPSAVNNGQLQKYSYIDDALNTSLTGTITRSFGSLDTRTQVRYLYEAQNYGEFYGFGQNFVVGNLPSLDALQSNKQIYSYQDAVRSEGYYLISNLTFRDRYIFDGLVRRDGSSLFGPSNRWNTYYRASGAWRVSEEPFFSGLSNSINELKLRYSIGTAGNRPNFDAQYETFSVGGGGINPIALGNVNLKPEFVTEREAGIDAQLFNRFNLSVNRVNTTAKDQLLQVPLPAYAGYQYQWQNAGTLKSNTWEASLEAQVIQRKDFNWSARVLFDQTRQKITALDSPCYLWGNPNLQNVGNVFYNCPGEVMGSFYGKKLATQCSELNGQAAQDACAAGQFMVNDDGYLVYVGAGHSYTEGNSAHLWGTKQTFGSITYDWGAPIYGWGKDKNGDPTQTLRLGNTTPDYNASFSTNMTFRGLNLYAQFDASQGFDVYNQTRQWAMFYNRAGEMDQVGKAAELQKPIGYYSVLYGSANVNSHFVEDGSYVKLREVAARYTLSKNTLSGLRLGRVDHITFGVSGRNLKTWTNYRGYDPEVGVSGSVGGSAAISRFDAFGYPHYRTLTTTVEIGF